MNTQEKILQYIKKQIDKKIYEDGMLSLEHVNCNDGFIFSMQMGAGKYCNTYHVQGESDLIKAIQDTETLTFEIGYPTQHEELFQPHKIEDAIYETVPLQTIVEAIEKHGGLKCFAWADIV